MLLDADELDDGVRRECDVCVVGGGAAGIAIGLSLARRGIDVCLLEGGGTDYEESSQELYSGRVEPPFPDDYLAGSRLRFLGGSTNHWLGYCRPFDAWDFEARPWVPHSGWPISRADLDEFYASAARLLEIPESLPQDRPLVEPSTRLLLGCFHRNPLRIGARYLDDLRRDGRLELVLHASAVEVEVDASGNRVEDIRIVSPGGRTARVRARDYVLSLGAIENVRLLLASRSRIPHGLGNDRDLVGRFFLEHPVFSGVARMVTRGEHGPFHERSPEVAFQSCLVDRTGQETEKIGGCSLGVDLLPRLDEGLAAGIADRAAPALAAYLRESRTAVSEEGAPTPTLRGSSFDARPEPAPDPESRVTLQDEVDRLGVPKVALHVPQGLFTLRAAARSLELLATAAGAHGLGRLWIEPDVSRWKLAQGFHHAGGTRMHADPSRGVVDADCRVHGIENLFVAGGSVFPTAGAVNPTLTIVALALRLVDHMVARR